VVIGAGVSIALTEGRIPLWKGLIENGFEYGVKKRKITQNQSENWKNQLNSNDIDDLLSAAEFMARKLCAPSNELYLRWFEDIFKSVEPTAGSEMEAAIKTIHNANIPICTLNYDTLLERITGLPTITLNEISKAASWVRRETEGVLHLHGSWESPSTCILSIRDYETTLSNDVRDLFQRSIWAFKRMLFVGCGDTFSDPNFSALIKWLRAEMKTAALQHFALVSEKDFATRHADPAWHGLVDPISYGLNHNDLPRFLLQHFSVPVVVPGKKAQLSKPSEINIGNARILEDYRIFLLKDCGQMTIEGVRADMDTAQRRFDIERLFVPLKVLPFPPEISRNDPEREQKLQEWKEKNKDPLSFGEVFAKHKHIALLALPGGGKTMLLKRLAVAYANPNRRKSSEDNLPDIDLMPVIIRCRE
jgi:hypothetical protein